MGMVMRIVGIAVLLFISIVSIGFSQSDEYQGFYHSSFQVSESGASSELSGAWEFYPDLLLEPSDIGLHALDARAIQVPGSWRKAAADGSELQAFGYGTYRTVLVISENQVGQKRALVFHNIGSAYRLWIDGKPYGGVGMVGTNSADETPLLEHRLVEFRPEDRTVELVIQVSNFSFREGGIVQAVKYGDPQTLNRAMFIDTCLAVFLMGAALFMGLYHLIMAMIRKQNRILQLVGCLSFAYGIRTFAMTEHVALAFFPSFSWREMVRMEYAAGASAILLLALLVRRLFPAEANRFLVGSIVAINTILLAIVFCTPSSFFTKLLPYHPLLSLGILLYLLIAVAIKAKKRQRAGATWQIVGISILLIACLNDTLNYIMVLHTFYVMNYAGFLFVLIQGLIAAKRYEQLQVDNRALSSELHELNRLLQLKVEERTQELREQKRELEETQQTRTRLLANVAHDIGTPIAGLHAYMHMLRDGRLQGQELPVYDRMIDKLSSIQRLNQDLLELSKLESRTLPFYVERIPFREWFGQALESLQSEYLLKGVVIECGKEERRWGDEEVQVEVDRHRLWQVMYNLVSNAVKFGLNEECRVILHCWACEENGYLKAQFAVEDFGKGISREHLPYIFQQFYRRSENSEGSGIGLAIVKQIVDQHGGAVKVRNKPEGGCIFTIALPAWTASQ
ncbi:sensor histidine kinase [Paenibacillus sp. HB172176]|uniref:sensor histidine kinase n=1 Tax=Paenibacillus sp. HB172176 TaxID=2493690 RepID=UPI001438EB02|nr:sensor histidine kinase [Paenibacillus sp. HB172176]